MGVTHKLKKEVIDFIVAQKRENPRLGCRKLAEITSAKFEVNVSKSSVNAILKDSNLSNSVGRPTQKIETKKFQIPSEKKQQISQELHKIPLPVELSNDSSADLPNKPGNPSSLIASASDNNIEKELGNSPDVEEKPAESQQDQPKESDKPAQKVESFEEQVARIRQQNAAINKLQLKNAGIIFLLASMWENISQDLLGSVLAAYNLKQEKNQFDDDCIVRFLLNILDINVNDVDDMNVRNLLKIMGFMGELKLGPDLSTQEPAVDEKKRMLNKCDLEIKQLHNMAGLVKIKMSKGVNVHLDAKLSHIGQKEASLVDAVPLQATFVNLAEYVIGNHSTLFLLNKPEDKQICDKMAELFAAFEGLGDQMINSIEIFDFSNVSLAELSMISPKKRHLAIAVYPQQAEFKELTQAAQWATRDPYYFEETDAIYHYTVTKTDFFDKAVPDLKDHISVVTIWEDNSDQPIGAILTNSKNNHKSLIKRCLREMLGSSDHSTSAEMVNGKEFAQMEISFGGKPTYVEVFTCFQQFLEKYVKWQYFSKYGLDWDENLLISDIYGISGEFYEKDGELVVNLSPNGAEDSSTETVKTMIQCVNERSIFDHRHRLLRLDQKK